MIRTINMKLAHEHSKLCKAVAEKYEATKSDESKKDDYFTAIDHLKEFEDEYGDKIFAKVVE